MDPKQISAQIKNGKIILIDVREKNEWDAGHIQGALHIPLGELEAEADVVKTIICKDRPCIKYKFTQSPALNISLIRANGRIV